jgi:hypothetical protein
MYMDYKELLFNIAQKHTCTKSDYNRGIDPIEISKE